GRFPNGKPVACSPPGRGRPAVASNRRRAGPAECVCPGGRAPGEDGRSWRLRQRKGVAQCIVILDMRLDRQFFLDIRLDFAIRPPAASQDLAMPAVRSFRYFDFVMVAFVVVLLCSNLIGPAKIAVVELPFWGPFVFGAGAIFFPISYVFGDILTEVYGYAQARKVIWAGFAALLFASLMAAIVVALPPAPFWQHQQAFEVAFGTT